jgi:hypothetical protein
MKEKGSRIVKTILFNEDNEHELDGGSKDVQRRMRRKERQKELEKMKEKGRWGG